MKKVLKTIAIIASITLVLGITLPILSNYIVISFPDESVPAVQAQIGVIETALAAHRLDNLSYPSSLDGLVENISNKHSWNGPYLMSSQLRDPWGEKFKYKMPGTEGRGFDLYSLGADKKEGGEGDNADVKHWE